MSATPISALVPAGARPNGGAPFAQQGTVDWVALGQSQFSASVAILGRLSSAGIEPLTVAVGQAMCSKIPLGAHGEKVLRDAMASLKACSSFGDVVWFGVGVRHILRVLVQTAQGASLVALCAALSESHSLSTCALVLYEMSKQSGSPKELTPSFAQWEAIVRVCASVFCPTTFSIRVDQFLKLAGYDLCTGVSSWAGHPQDLAKIISAVGSVAAGELLELHVVGGPACSWVAVYADLVLGLRVSIQRRPIVLLSLTSARAQVKVQFSNEIICNAITCVGRVFTLRSGDDFIRNIIQRSESLNLASTAAREPFLGGRLQWGSMFWETFGTAAGNLLKPPSWKNGPLPNLERPKTEAGCFVYFFVACARYYTSCTTECVRYGSAQEFIHTATNQMAELRPLKEELEELEECLLADMGRDPRRSDIESDLICAAEDLGLVCQCVVHKLHSLDNQSTARFCSLGLAGTIVLISYVLGRIRVEASLKPRRSGILAIYDKMTTSFSCQRPQNTLMHPDETEELRHTFASAMKLFSGEPPSLSLGNTVSAVSDGRVYCLVDTVRELSDRFERASVIHVGIGSIQVGHRLHYKIYDRHWKQDWMTEEYEPRRFETVVGNIPRILSQDTTSPELQVEAVVEDSICLSFWYRLWSRKGHILISPATFVGTDLWGAIAFRRLSYTPNEMGQQTHPAPHPYDLDTTARQRQQALNHEAEIQTQSFQAPDFDTSGLHELSVAHGEGAVPAGSYSAPSILLRPHSNNLLGRCAALATSFTPVIILNREADLRSFAASYQSEISSGNVVSWTLI
ncbi:MAG: hypothetical protein Q9208_000830 [Pyrenodesmia sp. 3 TL-2023]